MAGMSPAQTPHGTDRMKPRQEGWKLNKVFELYIANALRDEERYAVLDLPATPYEMLDALEKSRKQIGACRCSLTLKTVSKRRRAEAMNNGRKSII